MGGVLRAEPLWVETFTGLRMGRFEKVVKVVRERDGSGPGGGRPWCLPLADRVLLVAPPGYNRLPQETARRFLPYGETAAGLRAGTGQEPRLYRTGDLVRGAAECAPAYTWRPRPRTSPSARARARSPSADPATGRCATRG